MSAFIQNLFILAPNYRYWALATPYRIAATTGTAFVFNRNFRFWLAVFMVAVSIASAGLYVFSVQASFVEARELRALETRRGEESKAVAEAEARTIEISSPKLLRAAAVDQAMIEISQPNFIRQDSAVAFRQVPQP